MLTISKASVPSPSNAQPQPADVRREAVVIRTGVRAGVMGKGPVPTAR